MQKSFIHRLPQGRFTRWYAGIILAVVIGCGVAMHGWFFPGESSRSALETTLPATPEALPATVKPQADFGKLPLYFVENRGQVDKQVAYYVHGRDTQAYFTTQGLTFVLHTPAEEEQPKTGIAPVSLKREEPRTTNRYILKLDFVDSDPNVQPRGEEQTEAVISYFKGSQDQWQTGLKTYQKVVYPDLWPGIDLVYSGDSRRLKYTFVVKPGADPQQIQLAYRGATDLTLTDTGQLRIHTPEKLLTEDKPYTYQEIDGRQVEVSSVYQLTSSAPRLTPYASRLTESIQYGFQLGAYDTTRPLVIDPVVFVYAGYIGGTNTDFGRGIAVDSAGNAYVTGYTNSTQSSFPDGDGFGLLPGSDQTFNGVADAFVVKVNATGTALVYAGYIGGAGEDHGYGIAVDSAGNAYVTGYTRSDQGTFPEKGGPDLTLNGNSDAFVAKVNATGTALVYAGYIGGALDEYGSGIAVDSAGNAYVTGGTSSLETSFPDGDGFGTLPGPDQIRDPFSIDAFVVKVNAAGTALVYAGYIGGASDDRGYGIAVDRAGNAYVTGETGSAQTSFPETTGPDLTYNGGFFDAFVAKVNVAGTALVYAGYIGGASDDRGYGIAVDSAGNAYVTGVTGSEETSFPDGDGFGALPGPDRIHNSFDDAFVAKINPSGTALVYAGYIGGDSSDIGYGIAVDRAGNAYVVGDTDSDQATFPEKLGPDLTYNGARDTFVAKVNMTGTALVYAGYIGGNSVDSERGFSIVGTNRSGIAVDSAGNAYVVGSTRSAETTFPDGDGFSTLTGWDKTRNSVLHDAFVAKIGGLPLAGIGVFRTTAPNVGRWYFDANRDGLLNVCTIDKCLGPFGASTDIPVVGRWNGVGNPRLGAFTPTTRVWRLDLNGNGVWDGTLTDRQFVFGIAGDLPVVGDWTGNGITRIGVFRSSNRMWYLDKNNNGVLEACTIDICLGPFGTNGDRAVVGDWSGNGKTKIGVYRPTENRWYIDYNGNGQWNGTPTDKLWTFGVATDRQVVGDWTGDGKTKIGFFRPGTGMWYLDANGNGVWNASGDLLRGPFGLATDKPVAGAW